MTSPAVLFALGESWADVRVVPDSGLDGFPNGSDVDLLQVNVTPHPVPLNRAVPVAVHATSLSPGSSVVGKVKIDGKVVGVANTNAPFSYTFQPKRRRVSVRPPEWEVTFPIGVVVAPGYPNAPIDFGFPDV